MNFFVSERYKYGLMLSGGLDSAILLGLLCKRSKNIKIQPFTIPKTDGAMLYADRIIEFYNKLFEIEIPKTIVVGDIQIRHRDQSRIAIKEILNEYDMDYILVALNKNPNELNHLPGAPIRDVVSKNPRVIFPFSDMLKTEIIKLALENNLEEIFDITHSCTEQYKGRCNQCWQCKERSWAFEKLGILDTGYC